MSQADGRGAQASASVDPRIHRTRVLVINAARELLNEGNSSLTFAQVAERADVARQTLYKHWGTIENLMADTIRFVRDDWEDDYKGLDVRGRAHLYLTRISTDLDRGMVAATNGILAARTHNPLAQQALGVLDETLFDMFVKSVGPATHDQFYEIVTPVLFLTLCGIPPSFALINALSQRAEQLLPEGS